MRRSVVFFVTLVAFASSQTTQVSQCIVNQGQPPINLYIENCITPPCLLPQLQDAVIHMVFQAPRTIPTMRTLGTAYMSVLGINVPIEYDLGAQAETCKFLQNSFCPVLKDEVLLYQLNMFIEPFMFVGTQVAIEFRVVDENNVPILCLRVVIRIVAPVDTLAGPAVSPNATFVLIK